MECEAAQPFDASSIFSSVHAPPTVWPVRVWSPTVDQRLVVDEPVPCTDLCRRSWKSGAARYPKPRGGWTHLLPTPHHPDRQRGRPVALPAVLLELKL